MNKKKNNRLLKEIPKLKSEDEERDFWDNVDTAEYFDYSKSENVKFPNLKRSTETISLRLTKSLLNDIKILANKRDVPYQSLIKIFLTDSVRKELKKSG